jgi:hypothetical protein
MTCNRLKLFKVKKENSLSEYLSAVCSNNFVLRCASLSLAQNDNSRRKCEKLGPTNHRIRAELNGLLQKKEN